MEDKSPLSTQLTLGILKQKILKSPADCKGLLEREDREILQCREAQLQLLALKVEAGHKPMDALPPQHGKTKETDLGEGFLGECSHTDFRFPLITHFQLSLWKVKDNIACISFCN